MRRQYGSHNSSGHYGINVDNSSTNDYAMESLTCFDDVIDICTESVEATQYNIDALNGADYDFATEAAEQTNWWIAALEADATSEEIEDQLAEAEDLIQDVENEPNPSTKRKKIKIALGVVSTIAACLGLKLAHSKISDAGGLKAAFNSIKNKANKNAPGTGAPATESVSGSEYMVAVEAAVIANMEIAQEEINFIASFDEDFAIEAAGIASNFIASLQNGGLTNEHGAMANTLMQQAMEECDDTKRASKVKVAEKIGNNLAFNFGN